MLVVSQLFKYLADSNLAEMTANKIETKVDNMIGSHHGPMVQSAHVSMDEIVAKRQEHLDKMMESGSINEWNKFTEMQKEENRFDPDKLREEIAAEKLKQSQPKQKEDESASRLLSVVSFFATCALTISNILLT